MCQFQFFFQLCDKLPHEKGSWWESRMVVILLVSPVATSNCSRDKTPDRNNNTNCSFYLPRSTYKTPREQYYVRHITKINISDVNSQVEHDPEGATHQGVEKNGEKDLQYILYVI